MNAIDITDADASGVSRKRPGKKTGTPGHTIRFDVSPTGCHLCTSHYRDDAGYPRIKVAGKVRMASAVVFEKRNGPIPEGMVVRHTCDTPACINPEHLILGTHAQNVADRVERERSACGERHGRAKLTAEQVREIRASGETSPALARRHGVDRSLIRAIRVGKVWKAA